MRLNVNGQDRELDDDYADGTLLWALRDGLGLSGTKYGCGIGICGSCAVDVDGEVARSCVVKVAAVAGKRVQTVEGLLRADGSLHPVQQAFVEQQVPQCGWCMNGQIMTAKLFLEQNPSPGEQQIVDAMNDNYCRCGAYGRIRAAVAHAARLLAEEQNA
jgi:isoquinoline 1-oxidoreductase alpha subunit